MSNCDIDFILFHFIRNKTILGNCKPTKCSSRHRRISKIHIQISMAIVISLVMHIPYYFQYDIISCDDTILEDCQCINLTRSKPRVHPQPYQNQILKASESMQSKSSYNHMNDRNVSVQYWMHCFSHFSETIWWQLWYYALEVSILVH